MMGPPSSLAALPADAALAAINAAAAAPSAVRVPTAGDTVVADECALSFDTPESSAGLYTSLASWRSSAPRTWGSTWHASGRARRCTSTSSGCECRGSPRAMVVAAVAAVAVATGMGTR